MSLRDPRHPIRLDPSGDAGVPTPGSRRDDDLDDLLREWHRLNRDRAAVVRDRVLAAISEPASEAREDRAAPWRVTVRRLSLRALVPLAAAAAIAMVVFPLLRPGAPGRTASLGPASAVAALGPSIAMAPSGGRLDASTSTGDLLGPCVLRKTEVRAAVFGPFARVTVTQRFHNPFPAAVNATYTLPLPEAAAIDRAGMIIGDRVVAAMARERGAAREQHDEDVLAGRTASLIEQQRPQVFAQSLVNIPPGAEVAVQVSYVEQLRLRGGEFEFSFPTTLSPRFAAAPVADRSPGATPPGFVARDGLVLLAPGELRDRAAAAATPEALVRLLRRIERGTPIAPAPGASPPSAATAEYDVVYPDGSTERARLFDTDIGEVNGRWFRLAPAGPETGAASAPSAPAPVDLEVQCAGSELDVSVVIDTGGAGIIEIDAPDHRIVRQDIATRADGMPIRSAVNFAADAGAATRDFVLRWRATAMKIEDALFVEPAMDGLSGWFAVMLMPPSRVPPASAVSRELVVIVNERDAGSESALGAVHRLLSTLSDRDTLNAVRITAGPDILWTAPVPATSDARSEARAFIEGRAPGRRRAASVADAIFAAFRPASTEPVAAIPVAELFDTPADGREVIVRVPDTHLDSTGLTPPPESALINGRLILNPGEEPEVAARLEDLRLPLPYMKMAERRNRDDREPSLIIRGRWMTDQGQRVLRIAGAELADAPAIVPLRYAVVIDDGSATHRDAIVEATRRCPPDVRLFTLNIGEGRESASSTGLAVLGEPPGRYVSGFSDAGTSAQGPAAAERLGEIIAAPVLTHLSAELSGETSGVVFATDLAHLPDLYDSRPVVLVGYFQRPVSGDLILRGQTAAGAWERRIHLRLPEAPARNSVGRQAMPTAESVLSPPTGVVAHLWAQAKIRSLLAEAAPEPAGADPAWRATVDARIVGLAESFGLVTPLTSLVAVDYRRIDIDGQPRLAPVPAETHPLRELETILELPQAGEHAGAKAVPDATNVPGQTSAGLEAPAGPRPTTDSRISPPKARSQLVGVKTVPPRILGSAIPRGASGGATAIEQLRGPSAADVQSLGNGARGAGAAGQAPDSPAPTAAREPFAAPSAAADSPSTPPAEGEVSLADEFYTSVRAQLAVAEARGVAAPDRLAAVAATNFIVRSTLEGRTVAAKRAAEQFAPVYPTEPLLQEAALAAAGTVPEVRESAAAAMPGDEPPRPPAAPEAARSPQRPGDERSEGLRGRTPPPARDEVADLARRAERAVEQERTLIRRLDPRLYQLLPEPAASTNDAQGRAGQHPDRLVQSLSQRWPVPGQQRLTVRQDGQLLVSILVAVLDDRVIAGLGACGARIEWRLTDSTVVVARVRITDLVPVALCEGVVRIEPVVEDLSPLMDRDRPAP